MTRQHKRSEHAVDYDPDADRSHVNVSAGGHLSPGGVSRSRSLNLSISLSSTGTFQHGPVPLQTDNVLVYSQIMAELEVSVAYVCESLLIDLLNRLL